MSLRLGPRFFAMLMLSRWCAGVQKRASQTDSAPIWGRTPAHRITIGKDLERRAREKWGFPPRNTSMRSAAPAPKNFDINKVAEASRLRSRSRKGVIAEGVRLVRDSRPQLLGQLFDFLQPLLQILWKEPSRRLVHIRRDRLRQVSQFIRIRT